MTHCRPPCKCGAPMPVAGVGRAGRFVLGYESMEPASPFSRRAVLAALLAPCLAAPSLSTPGMAAPAPRRARGALPLVVLDPGHGGRDPGATGTSGTHEKHVTMAAALELRRQLERGGACRVDLTRTRDVFIPLRDRVSFAQSRGAALFMSLHADAMGDRAVRGASVYTLSDTASDAQSAALAQRENSVDQLGGPAFNDVPPAVASILGSLVRQETRVGAARAASRVVGALQQDLPLLHNPRRHAGFMVLRAADIPSVLVEMGFISNLDDERALRRPEHRARVAGALRRAVEAYLSDPAGRTAG